MRTVLSPDELQHVCFAGMLPARRRTGLSPERTSDAKAPLRFAETEEPLDPFIQWLFTRSGLEASRYRSRPLHRRLAACLRAIHARSTDEAREMLEREPDLLGPAVDALLLGVTEFFRDQPVFDALGPLLPRLAAQPGGLSVWSAACSDGSELYSIAILLAELGLLGGSKLYGTDCRSPAIAAARSACYPPSSVARLPRVLRDRYFEPANGRFRVIAPLRSRASFEAQDVFQNRQRLKWDVILWRNMAIYLRPLEARRIWRQLTDRLRPEGIVVTGKAERPDSGVPMKRLAGCIYARAKQ